MAKADIKMPEGFLLKISKLGAKTDDIIPKVLNAGGKIALEKIKSNLKSAVGKETKYPSRSTGELVSALGISPALLDKDGNHTIKVGFSEPRTDGQSNAVIAAVIEYGKSNQPPKPFLKPAKAAVKTKCTQAVSDAFDEEVKKL